jgi:hypothetical protein
MTGKIRTLRIFIGNAMIWSSDITENPFQMCNIFVTKIAQPVAPMALPHLQPAEIPYNALL